MQKSFSEKFVNYCNSENFEINENQIIVVKKIQDYYKKNFKSFLSSLFSKEYLKKSFYLYGDVGVGKTMVLNFFFNEVKEKKLRLHFNEFMLNFHNFVHENKNKKEENVISLFVKDLKLKASLIYFDEFQVTNIVDAMILGKLFENMFKENIKIILTSNIKISELYRDGLQRDQFKPFINIMEDRSIEYKLIIEDDYRKIKENQKQRYFFPLNQVTNFEINKFFRKITKNKKKDIKSLNVKGRKIIMDNFYGGIVKFNFDELCDRNLGSEDYLSIANNCKFIFIENLPDFDENNSNQQQRFITLIDILYEKKIPLLVSSKSQLDSITSSNNLRDVFKRTISRLHELTSASYNLK